MWEKIGLGERTKKIGLGLALIVCLILAVLFYFGDPYKNALAKFFTSLELRTLDLRFHLRGQLPRPEEIVIVGIDDESIEALESRLGRWPWSRRVHGKVVRILKEAGAKAIVFDVFFCEPHKYDPEGDLELAKATQEAGNVFYAIFEENVPNKDPEGILRKISRFCYDYNPKDKPRLLNFGMQDKTIGLPLPEILKHARGIGFVDVPADPDDVYRKPYVVRNYLNKLVPSLALSTVAFVKNLKKDQLVFKLGKYIKVGKVYIPLLGSTQAIINFAGPNQTFEHIPYYMVYQDQIDASAFKDKIVWIGATSPGLYDLRASPFGSPYFGVETNANFTRNILRGDFIKPTSKFLNILILFFFGILMGFTVSRLKPLKGAAFTIVLVSIYGLLAYYLFAVHRLAIDMAAPSGTILLSYTGIVAYRFLTEEREKRRIRNTFQLYLAPEIVDIVAADPKELKLGGVRKEVSILFSDIRNFTATSERMEPEEVVRLLNEYFTSMTEIIFKYEGTLDKFVGDAIMAIWGAPMEQEDHAQRAVKAAVEMQDSLKRLQDKWLSEGREAFGGIGIGVNTGEAVIGNIGSERRLQYTAIGDNVNLASRLEALNKEYGTSIIISESTYERVKDMVEAEYLGSVTVKGKSEATPIYSVSGLRQEKSLAPTAAATRATESLSPTPGSSKLESLKRKSHEVL